MKILKKILRSYDRAECFRTCDRTERIAKYSRTYKKNNYKRKINDIIKNYLKS